MHFLLFLPNALVVLVLAHIPYPKFLLGATISTGTAEAEIEYAV